MESENRLSNPNDNDHIIMLYEKDQERDDAVARYLNEGLKRNQLCVYASVHVREKGHLNLLAGKIEDYEENVAHGNLIILDLAPFYVAAMSDNLNPFENIKQELVEKAKTRNDKHVRLVGDCVTFLFKNKHFEQCMALEGWWQQKPFVGSYMCPFPRSIFDSFPHDYYQDSLFSTKHDVAIDAEGRVLVAEAVGKSKNGGKQ